MPTDTSPSVTEAEKLVERLRRTHTERKMRAAFGGIMLDCEEEREALVNPDGPEAADEIERLRAQLEEARGAALDEAAEVADLWGTAYAEQDAPTGEAAAKDIATAIRARISGRG